MPRTRHGPAMNNRTTTSVLTLTLIPQPCWRRSSSLLTQCLFISRIRYRAPFSLSCRLSTVVGCQLFQSLSSRRLVHRNLSICSFRVRPDMRRGQIQCFLPSLYFVPPVQLYVQPLAMTASNAMEPMGHTSQTQSAKCYTCVSA